MMPLPFSSLIRFTFISPPSGPRTTPSDRSTTCDREQPARPTIETRRQARIDKDFATSDSIRDELEAIGIKLMDGPEGTDWKPSARLDVADDLGADFKGKAEELETSNA